MKSMISWFQNLVLRQVMTIFLVAFAFLTIQFVGYGNLTPAKADTVRSSQGVYYKGVPDDKVETERFSKESKPVENSKNVLKNAADNIREKLNLDEPVPQSTKDFVESTKERIQDTVKPATTPEQKYYQAR